MRTKNDYIFVYLVATDKGVEEARLRDCVDGEFSSITFDPSDSQLIKASYSNWRTDVRPCPKGRAK